MIVWTTMLLLILLTKLVMGRLETDKQKKTFLIISALFIIFAFGSRNAVVNYGTDLNNYYRIFIAAINMPWTDFINASVSDIGYTILNKAIATVLPWPQAIVYFMGAATTGLMFRFIYRNVKDVFLGVLIYISLGTFAFFLTAFRQSLAIVLCLWAYEYLKDRKLFKFILVVLLASTMHQTAVIFLPFYYLGNRKARAINDILTFGIFFAAVFFTENLLNWGNQVFDRDYTMLSRSISLIGGIINISVYLVSIILGVLYINRNKDEGINRDEDNKQVMIYIQMLIIGTGLYAMRFQAVVMERIAFYYTPAVIVLLPKALSKLEEKTGKGLLYFAFVSVFIVLFIWRFYTIKYDYTFFWRY